MIRKALGLMIGGVLALAFMSFVPSARADLSDQSTQLTFNQPVQLPPQRSFAGRNLLVCYAGPR